MIKLKLAQLESAIGALESLSRMDMPIKLAYGISRIISKVTNEVKLYEDARTKLIEKYGQRDSEGNIVNNGGSIPIKLEEQDAFQRDFLSLVDTEIEINCHAISVDRLLESGVNISPRDLVAIDVFLDTDTDTSF